VTGSSPLARGLRPRLPRPPCARGIIPARAGFTWRRKEHIGNMEDHPRSRGVYAVFYFDADYDRGSSPLARGLPIGLRRAPTRGGIIPARAGFTQSSTTSSPSSRDHPRSRGVYDAAYAQTLPSLGSSPLARGLPPHSHKWRRQVRIIPARAGFTSSWRSRARATSDHPRSRGVYAMCLECPATRFGSSPLARGLLPRGIGSVFEGGIIPARAGFTSRIFVRSLRMKDHPRSRGVYDATLRRSVQ